VALLLVRHYLTARIRTFFEAGRGGAQRSRRRDGWSLPPPTDKEESGRLLLREKVIQTFALCENCRSFDACCVKPRPFPGPSLGLECYRFGRKAQASAERLRAAGDDQRASASRTLSSGRSPVTRRAPHGSCDTVERGRDLQTPRAANLRHQIAICRGNDAVSPRSCHHHRRDLDASALYEEKQLVCKGGSIGALLEAQRCVCARAYE